MQEHILGAAYAEGNAAVILLEEDISLYEELTLTVTGYNTTTVIESVQVGDGCIQNFPGDINGDSLINILDVIVVVNIVLGVNPDDNCQLELSDVNGDGILNILDIVIVVNLILGS